jgi:signal transduction histidine kinase/DNA-binding response OmpR family regulator
MIEFLRRLSIRAKLIVIIMSVTMTALLISSVAYVIYDVATYRTTLEEELRVLAQMTGDNCAAALQFDDASGAAEVLATFRNRPSILSAGVFTSDSVLFAAYDRTGQNRTRTPHDRQPPLGVVWTPDDVRIVLPIESRDRPIGAIALRCDLSSLQSTLQKDILIVGALFVLTGLAAFVLATRLQRVIVRPVLELSAAAKHVAETKDYSIRSDARHQDEIAELARAFNRMLSEIQDRETSLKNVRDHLEELVEERTQRLQTANEQLQNEMTEREKVQARLITAKEEAEKANRLKSQFLANISHELRTPMNSILGFSNLLLKSGDPKVRDYAETIQRSGQRLMRLIDDILDLSKVEAGKIRIQKKPFDVRNLAVLKDTMAPLLQGKSIDFTLHFDPDLPQTICSDEVKIMQILTNLAGNAIKFTPSGFVRVECLPFRDGREILFRVEDSGIGIRPEHLDSIFEEFYQVDRDKGRATGSGLGLTISRQIAIALGGRLWVESAFGKGSSFYFTIDVQPSEDTSTYSPEEPADVSLPGNRAAADSLRILIAEDEESNQKLFCELLAGFDFRVVSDGIEALRECRREKPALVLMDIMMPNLDGEATLLEMRKDDALKDIPVIAVTARAMVGDREALMDKGFDGYLAKPINEKDLYAVIAAYGIRTDRAPQPSSPAIRSDILSLLHELQQLKFFQSQEIRRRLQKLKELDADHAVFKRLSDVYRRRNEGAFYEELNALLNGMEREHER